MKIQFNNAVGGFCFLIKINRYFLLAGMNYTKYMQRCKARGGNISRFSFSIIKGDPIR